MRVSRCVRAVHGSFELKFRFGQRPTFEFGVVFLFGRALAEPEREELIRLRKENRNLLMEREILKKASAFFAKEMK